MQRDIRLQGLSSEHHQALVLARHMLARAQAKGFDLPLAHELGQRFETELEPHFTLEEALLLPALVTIGEQRLAERTLTDHRALRELRTAALRNGDLGQIAAFARRLEQHVRFEERELFPCCESRLPGTILDEVSRRAPKR
jgi:hypothetical protein